MSDAERLTRLFGSDVLQAIGFLAPERAVELNAIIDAVPLDTMAFENGPANFYARVTGTEIGVRYAALLSLWVTASAAVIIGTEGLRAVRENVAELDASPGTPMFEAMSLIKVAKDFIRSPDAVWPQQLAVPDWTAPAGTIEHLPNNLFLAAAGWINLHEIAHFHLRHQLDDTVERLKQQEYEADAWATDWILQQCPPAHFEFRILTVAVAFAWIGLVDDVRRGSVDHPHAWDRLGRCMGQLASRFTDLSTGIELSTHVLKTVFLPYESMEVADTPLDAFFNLLFVLCRQPR